MTKKIKLTIIALLLFTVPVLSQTKPVEHKLSEELNSKVIDWLRETPQDVLKFRSTRNRLSFSIEIAHLLWEFDPKEALFLYQTTMNDVRQNLMRFDIEANLPENYDLVTAGNSTSGKTDSDSGGMDKGDCVESPKVKKLDYDFSQRFESVVKLRVPLIEALAKDAPELADEFLRETTQIVNNEEIKDRLYYQNKSLNRVVALAFAKRDSTKTLEMGRKMLLQRDLDGTSGFLEELYELDSAKATILADEYLKRLENKDSGYADLLVELNAANEKIKSSKNKKPLVTEGKVRQVIESIAQTISNKPNFKNPYTFISLVPLFDKYVPAIGLQIRQKYSNDKNPAIAEMFKSMSKATSSENVPHNSVSNESENDGGTNQEVTGQKLTEVEKKEILDDLRTELGRAKKSEKPALYFEAARYLAKSSEKELAMNLLEEVKTYASRQIRNANDAEFFWNMVTIYASIEPNKSFELLETTIPQLENISEAFVIVSPFLEPEDEEFLENWECDCSFVNSMIDDLSDGEETILNLANADFERTRRLVYRFNRPEVQIALKLVIIKSLLEQNDSQTEGRWNRQFRERLDLAGTEIKRILLILAL
jgi:hypothetical protein